MRKHIITADLTLVAGLAGGGLTLYLIENYGQLSKHGHVRIEGNRLTGQLADAIRVMSILTVLFVVACIVYVTKLYAHNRALAKMFIVALVFSVIAAGLNLHLVEHIGDATLDVETGDKIRGGFGEKVLAFNAVNTSASGLTFMWMNHFVTTPSAHTFSRTI